MAADPTTDGEARGWLEKLGAALPVALAAVATTLAGMSSGEMARAMFWRSAAAQDQARAASQWTLAGFKRDRALIVQTAAATLRAGGGPTAEPPAETEPPAGVDPEVWRTARAWLAGDGPPQAELPSVADERIAAALAAARDRAAEEAQLRSAAAVPLAAITAAIRDAEAAVDRYDREWEPVLRAADRITALGRPAVAARRFELERRRYDAEARLNQGVSLLYEVRVRVTTALSDRHRWRSENFFYAMLVAQVGATGGSLALARRRRSALWLFAGLTGLVSIAFGLYVYLTL